MKELIKLPGIGLLKADILYDAGYRTLRELKRASVVELIQIDGIGRVSAAEIKTALREKDLEDICATEFTEELIGHESKCPLCETVISTYESVCYECGTTLKVSGDTEDETEEDTNKKALSHYDNELLISPDNIELWYARGSILMNMEEYIKALVSFDKILNIDPHNQNAWMAKADLFNKMEEPLNAAECYSHVVSRAALDQVIEASGEYEHIGENEDIDDEEISTLELQDPEELKKLLSKKAADLKELLIFAKDLSINIDKERGYIIQAIQYNRKGRTKEAIELLDKGCAKIENVLKGSTLTSTIDENNMRKGGNV
ncbi:MAG: hypothetical protein KAS16_00745 [Thermoplasmata archaeon]|nr:hypothetical protein [Thermoplasmata archaeon]